MRGVNVLGMAMMVGGGPPIIPHSSKPWIPEAKLRSGWRRSRGRSEPTRAEKKAKRKRRQKAQRRQRR